MITFIEWLKVREMAGSVGPYIGSCKGGPDFQVMGACSDLKPAKKKSSKKKSQS